MWEINKCAIAWDKFAIMRYSMQSHLWEITTKLYDKKSQTTFYCEVELGSMERLKVKWQQAFWFPVSKWTYSTLFLRAEINLTAFNRPQGHLLFMYVESMTLHLHTILRQKEILHHKEGIQIRSQPFQGFLCWAFSTAIGHFPVACLSKAM